MIKFCADTHCKKVWSPTFAPYCPSCGYPFAGWADGEQPPEPAAPEKPVHKNSQELRDKLQEPIRKLGKLLAHLEQELDFVPLFSMRDDLIEEIQSIQVLFNEIKRMVPLAVDPIET